MRLFYLLCLAISPLLLAAETIIVKTKAPQNKNAVFQYRVPKGYDKNRREMYRVQAVRLSINAVFPYLFKIHLTNLWYESIISSATEGYYSETNSYISCCRCDIGISSSGICRKSFGRNWDLAPERFPFTAVMPKGSHARKLRKDKSDRQHQLPGLQVVRKEHSKQHTATPDHKRCRSREDEMKRLLE